MHSHSSYYPPNSYAQQNYEKYELKRPDKDPLNQSLGVPDFFPCTRYAPEELLTAQTIENGFKETKYVSDVSALQLPKPNLKTEKLFSSNLHNF
jgi:hypothetical protein